MRSTARQAQAERPQRRLHVHALLGADTERGRAARGRGMAPPVQVVLAPELVQREDVVAGAGRHVEHDVASVADGRHGRGHRGAHTGERDRDREQSLEQRHDFDRSTRRSFGQRNRCVVVVWLVMWLANRNDEITCSRAGEQGRGGRGGREGRSGERAIGEC